MAVDQSPKIVRPRLTLEAMRLENTYNSAYDIARWADAAKAGVTAETGPTNEDDYYVVWFTNANGSAEKCLPGDWLIRAITGKFFKIPDDKFWEVYEEVGGRTEPPPSPMVSKERL